MESLGVLIKEYWGFVLFLLGLIFHAVWTYFRVGEHDKRLAELEKERTSLGAEVSKLTAQVQKMDTKLDILLEGYNKN